MQPTAATWLIQDVAVSLHFSSALVETISTSSAKGRTTRLSASRPTAANFTETQRTSKLQVATRICGYDPDLMTAFNEIPPFNYTFTTATPAVLEATGHIDCEHRNLSGTTDKAVMVAFKTQLNGSWIPGAVTGCNIVGKTDHYAMVPIAFSVAVPAGTHTVKIFGCSATSAAPSLNGTAKVKAGYNCVTYKVIPA